MQMCFKLKMSNSLIYLSLVALLQLQSLSLVECSQFLNYRVQLQMSDEAQFLEIIHNYIIYLEVTLEKGGTITDLDALFLFSAFNKMNALKIKRNVMQAKPDYWHSRQGR